MRKRIMSVLCCVALLLTAIPVTVGVWAAETATESTKYLVTADDVRVSSRNNATEYVWPIDFTEDDTGARMTYHLQASGAPANSAGAPYMQNLNPISQLDGAHLKLTLHNEVSSSYGDGNFMARKFVIKLANQQHQNGATSDLRYTFCVNDADPYIDVMSVTAENVATQRFYFSDRLDVFGNAVRSYSLVFQALADGGLRLLVNGVAVDLATAELLKTTSTDITKPVYLYIAADTDYTDITLNSFHGGEEPCLDPVVGLTGVAGKDTMTTYALNNAVNTDPFLVRTDIAGGGVHVKQTWGGAQYTYLYKENMQSMDGLTLRFGNYTSASGKPLAVYLARYENQWFYGVLPTLLIDPARGDLKLVRNIDNATFSGGQYVELATVITGSELLKQIDRSMFDIGLHLSEDLSKYYVVVTVGGEQAVGSIPVSILSGLGNGPTDTAAYVSFGNVDNDATDFEVDFYGYTHSDYDEAETADPTEGLTGIAGKDTMTDYALGNAKNTDPFLHRSDITGGGVHIEQTWGGAQYPYLYRENMQPLDGVTLRFGSYSSASGKPLALYLARYENQWFYGVLPTLLLDPVSGDLKLIKNVNNENFSGGAHTVIATLLKDNALVKRIGEGVFDVSLHLSADGKYWIVKLTMGDQAVAGQFKASIMEGLGNGPTSDAVYLGFGNINNDATDFTVNYYGYTHTVLGDVTVEEPEDEEKPDSPYDGVASADSTTDWYKGQTNTDTVLTDIPGGGVNIDQSSTSAERPYCYAPNLGGIEGLRLFFGNYRNKSASTVTPEEGSGKIGLFFSYVQNQFFYQACPTFIIDTNTGDLILGQNKDNATFTGGFYYTLATIISGSDLLKAATLADQRFTLTFINKDTDTLTVTVAVGDQTVSGDLKKSLLSQSQFGNTPRGGNCYLSIGGLNNHGVAYSLDFYGYKTGVMDVIEKNVKVAGTVAETDAAIAALPSAETVGSQDAAAVLTAQAMYTALSKSERALVAGAEKLSAVFAAYRQVLADSQYAPTSTYLARDPETGYAWEFPSPDGRTLFSYKTAKGFKVKLVPQGNSNESTGAVLRTQALTGAHALDGLSVTLDNFSYAVSGSFYLTFTSGDYDDTCDAGGAMVGRQISLLLAGGKELYISGAGQNKAWLAGTSSLLKADAIEGKTVTVAWNRLDSGDWLLSITVGDEATAFTIPAERIHSMAEFDEERVYVVFESPKTSTNYEVEFTGIGAKTDAATTAMMEVIAALPLEPTLAQVKPVWEQYQALTAVQKAATLNAADLTERYYIARNAAKNDQGYDADGYYIPGLADVAGDYKTNGEFVSTHESATGGLILDFNQTPYGICQLSAKTYVLDGLRLRLSNFRYATDGSLFVGFHSYEAYKQKIWTFDPQISRYGIYFQIGYNGQLRVTVPGTDQMTVLMEDPLLRDTALQGKEFILGFDAREDGTYQVSFTVDGTTLTAVLDTDYMAALDKIDLNAVWFIVHAGNGYAATSNLPNQRLIRNACSVDISGIQFAPFSKADTALINKTVNAIAALPDKASYAAEADILAVWSSYRELRQELRLAISNVAKLFDLQKQLYDLHAADGTTYPGEGTVDTIQLPDETVTIETIEKIYRHEEKPSDPDDDSSSTDEKPDDGKKDEPKEPVVETVINEKTVRDTIPTWIIILLSAGGAIVLLGGVIWAILLGKKNKKNGKEAK